jgi:predicted DCC family thiol-disulfide oxidoreductase YuxK
MSTLGRDESPVLLYDGDCGVCAQSVQFVLSRESATRQHALRFAPLQGEFAATVRVRHPEIARVDSVVWYVPSTATSSRVRLRSDAAFAAMSHVGGMWRVLAVLGAVVPRPIRDAVYDAIARRRLSLAAPACLLPTAEQRTRFLR